MYIIVFLSILAITFALFTPFSLYFPFVALIISFVCIYKISKRENNKILKVSKFIAIGGCIVALLNLSYYGLPMIGEWQK
ncbi:hypothetical protein [Halobacillus sp. A5]|uniref:hypothetical protein n=1 Tax=Halobacillus sp. A5 TaxID=2880263 RepID=UPI0020A6A860|nr:hypothetical protein [Halobacillus sp. A5]MCP3027670.1 hypothetical protein [Halobacillus sp. A5]